MRVLIVDDESAARSRLRRLLAAHVDLSAVLEAQDAPQALALLSREAPVDLAFLDVEMPGCNGLQLAQHLPAQTLKVFCTAYSEFALQAFEVGALDYLHKPFHGERLALCLERARDRLGRPASASPDPHWWLGGRGERLRIDLREVQWLAAADNYVSFEMPPRSLLERISLNALMEQAAMQAHFVRVHRSHAVNPAHVLRRRALESGDSLLTLRCGAQLRASRAYRPAMERWG